LKSPYVDWWPLRYLDIDTTAVREAIGHFCDKIVEALREPWLSPEERRKQQEIEGPTACRGGAPGRGGEPAGGATAAN
jgi:hypothetical protein